MVADPVFLGYVFVAAVLGAFLARAARQPLILGYVLAGILMGPFTPGPVVSDLHTFELFAEIGAIIGAQTAPGWRGQFVATGTVKTASPTGREFTLWDGRTFVVPKPPAFVSDDLMPGAFVHAVYTTMDGQNIVTELTVHRPTPDFRDRR